MSENHEHLDLPSVSDTYQRKTRLGGPSAIIPRDYDSFSKIQIKKLDSFASDFKEKKISDYEQELVFKLKTNRNVSDEQFRDELRKAGCDTLISKSGKDAEWIISTKDPSFTKLKEKIIKRIDSKNATFVDSIDTFENISDEDKIGPLLKNTPMRKIEVAKIVVSLTKKENDDGETKLNAAIGKIIAITDDHTFKSYDKLVTENLCLILIDANQNSLNEIMKLDLVTTVDRPAKFDLESIVGSDQKEIGSISTPPVDSHGILVVDSGIIRHPLLDSAFDSNGLFGLPDRGNADDRSHGTMVAGIALHGDIEKSITTQFNSELWIYSAKLFYEDNGVVIQEDEKLIESRLKESVEDAISRFPNCKIINLSLGYPNNIMIKGQKQFDLASLIDDLSVLHPNLIFVISMGNISPKFYQQNSYPDYLISGMNETKIIDPASSVYGISVGALQNISSDLDQPSNITKVGPGLNGMIKPELVDSGGGFHDEILVLNPKFRQRWFTFNKGTSFSAPKIAHQFGRLFNAYPNSSRNLIKALLISSAKIPNVIPSAFPKFDSSTSSTNLLKILNVYGYGKPNFDEAKQSDDNRVILKHDGKIKLDHVRYFTINLPQEFIDDENDKEISVTLVYDPPIRKTRAEYLGVRMEYHLFRNVSLDEVKEKYNLLELDYENENSYSENENSDEENENSGEVKIPIELKKYEISLKPGALLRKKSLHQKSWAKMTKRSKFISTHPLVLTLISQKRWNMKNNDMEIPFAVVVRIHHYGNIDLYNKLRTLNKVELRTEERIRI
jgi:hypothetical protein